MKTLLGILLSLGLVFASLPAVATQQVQNPVIAGIDEQLTWIGEDGSAMVTVQVRDVDTNFTDVGTGMAPDYGYRYQAILFTIENVSERSIIIEPSMFSTITDHGEVARGQYLEPTSESHTPFTEDVPLASGESADLMIVYTTPGFSELALFRWNPVNDTTLFIYLEPDARESSSVVRGMSSPAVYFDDFGNPIASMQVTGINPNWTAYSDFGEPDEGESYVAVHFSATNLTDRPVMVQSQHLRMVTGTGLVQRPSYVSAREDAQAPLGGETYIEPGESIDFYVVFESSSDAEVIAVQWNPNWSENMFVMLTEEGSATPEATPASD